MGFTNNETELYNLINQLRNDLNQLKEELAQLKRAKNDNKIAKLKQQMENVDTCYMAKLKCALYNINVDLNIDPDNIMLINEKKNIDMELTELKSIYYRNLNRQKQIAELSK